MNPLTKFTSSRSTEFKDILPWSISQMIMEGGKAIVEQILASEERHKSRRADWDPTRKVNHLSKVV